MPDELHVALDVNGLGEWVADSLPESFTILTDDEVRDQFPYSEAAQVEINRLNSVIRRLTNGYNNTLRNAVERTYEHDGCSEGKFDFINGINFSWSPNCVDLKIVGTVRNMTISNPFDSGDEGVGGRVTNELPSYIDGEYVDWEVERV